MIKLRNVSCKAVFFLLKMKIMVKEKNNNICTNMDSYSTSNFISNNRAVLVKILL